MADDEFTLYETRHWSDSNKSVWVDVAKSAITKLRNTETKRLDAEAYLETLVDSVENLFAFVRKKHDVKGEFSCPHFRQINSVVERIKRRK